MKKASSHQTISFGPIEATLELLADPEAQDRLRAADAEKWHSDHNPSSRVLPGSLGGSAVGLPGGR